MSVTIKDVARVAGVSPSTVSRVISNSPSISEKTKTKVRTIMDELKYFPNMNARSLVNSTSRIIGLVLPDNTDTFYQNPFFPTVLRGMNEVADDQKYSLLLSSGNTEEERLDRIKTMVFGKQVDGLIFLYSKINDKIIEFLKEISFPFVVIGTPSLKPVNSVDNDNELMAYKVTDEIIKQGGKRIAFVGGDKTLNFIELRYEGYRKALEENEIKLDTSLVFNDFQFLSNVGYELVKELLKLSNLDGVVIADQLVARGIRSGWETAGKEPIPMATFKAYESQTTREKHELFMDIHAQKLGNSALSMLLDIISYNTEENSTQRYFQEIVEAELVL
ncbi:LacI family DNA-binding transcriptional regulator [Aerococcaceae bacterium DSM 111021]|nr:LacI family DNA-binding transcriptional regulator [Aerococcaceae bacterium DSM 111021]